MTTKRIAVAAFLAIVGVALPTFAQNSPTVTKGPIVIKEFKHDTSPLLREIAPLLPELGTPSEHEIENNVNPNHNWSTTPQADPVLQTEENSPLLQTPNYNLEFDGIGYGDNFFCNCMPPDNDGAPGTTQYVQYINLTYQVFDKQGNTVLGPLSGNSFWSGFGGACESDNSGDPVIRFDAAAQRWVVSQFAVNSSAPDYECIAVSTTADATGSYTRYAFPFSHFPDYPKFGVWPDAYYFTFDNFSISGTSYIGANVCAADRTKMLAGSAATIQCFQQNSSQYAMLPSDMDGPTPPAAGTPNFVMELDPDGSANLSMFQFHVDFTTPKNSTFTGPTLIPVAAFTPLCPTQYRGQCVPQPGAGTDLLESLGDRIMYRLVYRNFGDHTTLLASHSIQAGSSGGLRWYEIRNPETSPTLYQSGTFAPDSQFRWMPAIAMDKNQDIAVGFSRSSATSGDYPSLVYAGRVPTDPAGTLEAEVVLKAGAGSQKSGDSRWGDYSSLTIDPTDDCTFWFSEEYLKATGANQGFNWSTAVGTFNFPGCAVAAAPAVTLAPTSLTWGKVLVGNKVGPKTITLTNSGNATLDIDSIVPSGDFALAPVAVKKACGSTLAAGASCLIKVTFTPAQTGLTTGDITITDNAANSPQTLPLSGTGK
ncbi:MAG: choice-of-anchor D domain-containing protein [Terriglobales bacterium]